MVLDLVTLFYFFSVLNVALGLGLIRLWHRTKSRHLVFWAVGFFAAAVSFVFNALRDLALPAGVMSIMAYVMVSLALVCFHAGLCVLFGIRHSRLPSALLALEFVLLGCFPHDAVARALIHSSTATVIAGSIMAVLFRRETRKFANCRLDLGGPLALLAGLMLARAALVYALPIASMSADLAATITGLLVFGVAVAHIGMFAAFMTLHATSLQSELAEANRQLQTLSETDALTGLANRRKFDEALKNECARAGRRGRPLALLLMDIDNFKAYNDYYGHPQGDLCLKDVAWAVGASAQRATELAARYGGEEFAVILPDAEAGEAERVARKILDAVRGRKIPHGKSQTRDIVTLSIGVALCRPQDKHAASLVFRADKALYEAKRQGRDCYAIAA